ncbi:MAG: 30S ribosomal protein S9 [Candidatus Micrarchaeaceae archaeon]
MPEDVTQKNTDAPKGVKELDKELSVFNQEIQQVSEITKQTKKSSSKKTTTKKTKSSTKVFVERAKRKEAIARASIYEKGNGEIYLNGVDIKTIKPKEIKEIVLEPLNISPMAMELAMKSKIKINVHGGGVSGRAQAARNALAKAILKASGSDELKHIFMQYDRNILVDDYRRVEPKKYKGPKARARFQKSYR